MLEYQLQYRGKKTPFKTPPIIKPQFTFGSDPVWMPADCAETLMQLNPSMFYKLQMRDLENPIEATQAIQPKPELDVPEVEHQPEQAYEYVCEKCGKGYNVEHFYQKHIAKCDNDE